MKKVLFILTVALVSFSCVSDKKKSSEIEAELEENRPDRKSACLREFEDRYDELITKSEMASVYPFNEEEAKISISNKSYGHHTISWPSDRPNLNLKVAGTEMNVPDENSMSVAVLNFYSDESALEEVLKQFERGYKQLSEEELEQINKNLENAAEENREINQKLMDARTKMNYAYINNIGSSAWYKWNDDYGGELAVLANRAKFNVRMKISKDSLENLEYSKKMAILIIEKCR